MFYYTLFALLVFSGFVMGHGFANHNNQLIYFLSDGSVVAWIHFGITIFIAYRIHNVSSKESTDAANRILRQNQLMNASHDVDLVLDSGDGVHKLSQNYKFSESMSISLPQITELKLEKLEKNTLHKSG